jgi:hypothetical protein
MADRIPAVLKLEPLPGEVESPVITALAISPDESWCVAAGDDHAIRALRIDGSTSVQVLLGHRDWVQCVEFSPSGRWMASCGHDGFLRVWEFSNGARPIREIAAHRVDHALFSLCFAGENEIYAVGFHSAIYRFDLAHDQLAIDHECDCRDLRTIACSPDGHWLAYGGRDGVLRWKRIVRDHALASVVASDSARVFLSPNLHFGRIRGLSFSPDGQSLISVGEDRRLVRWNIEEQKATAQLDLRAGKLRAVCPLNNHLVAVSGSDNTIRIVDLEKNAEVSKWIGHDGSIAVLRCTPQTLVSGSFDTSIRTWNIDHAIQRVDDRGRFVHPVAAQFEDSSAQERIR